MQHFEIIGNVENVEIIAVGNSIREIARLRKQFGSGRCRKLKGVATVKLFNGTKSSRCALVRGARYWQKENEN